MTHLRLVAGACAFMLAACASPPHTSAPPPAVATALDTIVDDVVARYRLPGIAVGIVQDGRVAYTRTSGELIAGSGARIDADTLFKIASNSKAMTTGVLARLVDAGKLRWDDPVTRYLPHFRMSDDWITREIQVRDLLIHNSGLRSGAGDLMLWPEPNSFTRADILAGLAHLKPLHSFRSRYDYDNLLYVVAGEVAAAAGGAPYEELVRRELFEPLRMTRCQAGGFERERIGNVAQPHMLEGERNIVIRGDEGFVPTLTSAAAGGIRCSLDYMLRWLTMWLDPQLRAADGTPWLTTAQRDALWSAHMPMPLSQRQREWDGSRFNAYGYGWRLSDVDGVLRVAHTGTLAGMYSAVVLLPELRTGIVFMINGEGARARTVLSQVLTEYFTARGERRTVASYAEEIAAESVAPTQQAPDTSARVTVAENDMRASLGIYRDPWFGDVAVCAAKAQVVFESFKSPLLKGTVMRVGDRLLIDWLDASVDAEAWLEVTTAGEQTMLELTKVDPQADFSYDYEDLAFTRVGECPPK